MRATVLALAIAATGLMTIVPARAEGQGGERPRFHFTPPKNFINDPNGLVFFQGEYHLFYQHNPEGDRWGHMSWGHAVSKDLARWEHLPVALREEDGIMIFSGSAVVDEKNTTGLGKPGEPAMVAIYTGAGKGKQTQNIASSLDRGRSWTKFAGNPVLDIGSNEFRDPKVFRHKPTGRWVMATVLADKRMVRLWGSADLKHWEQLSDFGPAGSTKGVWECPELLEAPVEGTKETRWVLKVDVNDGAPAGGSGGQYFVGNFDGKAFKLDEGRDKTALLWIDFGKDFYASQSWNDAPGDGRPVWLAWMNNWQYANDIPTSPWRGSMTIPRVVSLRKTPDGLRLVQAPFPGLQSLRRGHHRLDARPIAAGRTSLDKEGIEGSSLEIIAEFDPGVADAFGLVVRHGEKEETIIGIDRRAGTVFIDRTRSGAVGFSPHFPGKHAAPLAVADGRSVQLHVLLDTNSVEVFADGGLVVLTDQVFPRPASRGVSLFAEGGAARLLALDAWELHP
ncbi:MAG TPA: glycoside hydrolase family 32 protein [Isosphaeraceae bacterium]|nr:glycoside hydrolase family 32 protein [Isosphaeraceae bacterium]